MMTKNKVRLFVVLVLVVFSVGAFFAHTGATEQQGLNGKNASLFESEWVAYSHEANKGGDHTNCAANPEYCSKCIKLNIKTIPTNTQVYVNEVYLGRTPVEYTIRIDPIFNHNDHYIFRIHKDGYRDETFEVNINSEENREFKWIFVDKFIELQEIDD